MCASGLFSALCRRLLSTLHTQCQKHRLYFLPFFLAFSTLAFTSSRYFWFSPSFASLWIQADLLYILHVTSLLYIEKFPAPIPSNPRDYTFKQQCYFKIRATWLLFGNPRLTSAVAHRKSPPLSGDQPRSIFVLLRLAKLPVYYALYFYVGPLLFSEVIVEVTPEDVGPVQQILLRRLPEVTIREVILRTYTAVSWIWESFMIFDGVNAILSSICVMLGIDNADDWPPLFGTPFVAVGLRSFWTRFWHGLATRPYKNYGKVVARGLGLQCGTFEHKILLALVAFGLSGLTHAMVARQIGRRDWDLEIWWFLLNFCACLSEVVLVSVLRSLARKLALSRELSMIEDSWLGHFLGFAWLFGFFFWSTPKWQYPRMYSDAIATERLYSLLAKMRIIPK